MNLCNRSKDICKRTGHESIARVKENRRQEKLRRRLDADADAEDKRRVDIWRRRRAVFILEETTAMRTEGA